MRSSQYSEVEAVFWEKARRWSCLLQTTVNTQYETCISKNKDDADAPSDKLPNQWAKKP